MRRWHEDERRAREHDDAGAVTRPISRAARMLALQRTAGNHAVAAMLAREAKPKQDAPAHAVAFVSGIGSIPLLSFSMPEPQTGSHAAPGGDREKPAKPPPRDVELMSTQGAHSSALSLAYSQGGTFEVELLVGEHLHLKLHKALIAAYSTGDGAGDGPTEFWTLSAESVEFITDGDKR